MKFKMMVAVIFLVATTLCVQAADNYRIKKYFVKGPVRANANWQSWANKVVEAIYSGNLSSIQEIDRITPEIISEKLPDLSTDVLWMAVDIEGLNGSTITPNMLRFAESSTSTDNANLLASSVNLVGSNSGYNLQTVGKMTSGEKITSGDGNRPMQRLVFIGMQSTYFQYSNAEEELAINNYIYNNNLTLNFSLEIVQGGTVVARDSWTIGTSALSARPTLSIEKSGSIYMLHYIGATANRNLILQSMNMSTKQWDNVLTFNSGSGSGIATNIPLTGHHGMFRTVYQ